MTCTELIRYNCEISYDLKTDVHNMSSQKTRHQKLNNYLNHRYINEYQYRSNIHSLSKRIIYKRAKFGNKYIECGPFKH